LVRNYNISPSDAYDKWYKAIAKKDDRIAEIIDNLIKASPEGLPVLINRNPTIRNPYVIFNYYINYFNKYNIEYDYKDKLVEST
jgi:hypothetical protein